MKLLSYSALDLFDQCERKFYYERVLKQRSGINHHMVIGEIYHRALESMLRGVPASKAADDALRYRQRHIVTLNLDRQSLFEELMFNLERVEDEYFGTGKLSPCRSKAEGWEGFVLERKWENEELGFRGVTDLLSRFAPVPDDRGVVQRFERRRCVIDWKTSSGKRRRSDRDARFSPQLALYCLHHKVTCAAFVEIPRDTDKPVMCRRMIMEPRERRHWKQYLKGMRSAILSRSGSKDDYHPCARSHPLCSPQWCDHWDKCYPA